MNKFLVTLAMFGALSAFAEDKTPATTTTVVLTKDNSIIFDQEVDAFSGGKTLQRAQEMDSKLASREPIYIVMDTPGGSIEDGLRLIAGLKALNRPIHTITTFSASMGFQMVQGLGDRLILPFGTLMAHKARGGFSGEFPGQIDSRYVYYIKRLDRMDAQTVARTKGKHTVKSLQAMYENESWLEGEDAVAQGLADKVVLVKCDHSLNGTRDTVFDFMGFQIVLVQSECPANTGVLDVAVMVVTDQGLMKLSEFQAKGGSFTTTTRYTPYTSNYSSLEEFGPTPETKRVPVLTTEGLTLEKINVEVEKIRQNVKKRKAVVKE